MRPVLLAVLLAACSTPGAGPASQPTAVIEEDPTAAPAPTATAQADALTAEGAWVRAVPPGSKNSAVFLDLGNSGSTLVQVKRARSTAAGAVELHTHVDDGGVMKMRQVESLDVPGQGHLHLAPGGDHVMLIGLTADLHEGDEVAVTLVLADGSEKTVVAPVKTGPAMAPAHGHDDGHGHEHGDGHGG